MVELVRCSTSTPDFRGLVRELDAELRDRYGEEQALYDPHNAVDAIETAVVALDEGRAVGCGCFKRHDATTIELKRVYVVRDRRGHRIAGRIVSALESWGRELGYGKAVLETGTSQPDAVALYTRCGYLTIPCFAPYDHLPSSICMGKTL
jgi:GNAT superfamily N-acetyltransferase